MDDLRTGQRETALRFGQGHRTRLSPAEIGGRDRAS